MSNKEKETEISDLEDALKQASKEVELETQAAEGELVDDQEEESVDENEMPSVDDLLAQVQDLRVKNNELIDQFTRAKAETENARRISVKEVEKARKFSLEMFAKELLLVKDSLDQAAQVNLEKNASDELIKQMADGLGLTLKQLESVFERFKIEVVNPEAGDKLDPALHQAMTKQPSEEVDSNNIINTIQVGYTLNERLLRPAMVIVSSGSAA